MIVSAGRVWHNLFCRKPEVEVLGAECFYRANSSPHRSGRARPLLLLLGRRTCQMVRLRLAMWAHQLHSKRTHFTLNLIFLPSWGCSKPGEATGWKQAGWRWLCAGLCVHTAVARGCECVHGRHVRARISNAPIQELKAFSQRKPVFFLVSFQLLMLETTSLHLGILQFPDCTTPCIRDFKMPCKYQRINF